MSTLDYYNQNAQQFVDGSLHADMSDHYKHFLKYLPQSGKILDLGCGSGRDTAAFRKIGYKVVPVDGSIEVCRLAEQYLQSPVKCVQFDQLDYDEEFDGVWACASLLHVPKDEMTGILEIINKALKPGGILYASYKYGNEATERNGRLFSNYNEQTINDLFLNNLWIVREIWLSSDVRKGRESERWVNVVVRKN